MANQVLYGFHNMIDLFNRRVTEVGVSTVDNAIRASLAEHNRQVNALLGFFAMPTTDFKTRFISANSARLQKLDNNGRARPLKTSGYYDVAFPLEMAGGAWGTDFVTSRKMRVEEVNRTLYTLQMADLRYVRDQVLGALYANASWSFTDEQHGSLTVQGLANADSVKYQILTGADAPATDDHYYAQANAIDDGADNPFPTIYDELTEHPENGGEVVVFVPSNLTASIEALATFKEKSDPNIREGANTSVLVGNLQAQVPGKVIGYADKCWIVEWKSLPDSYMVAVTTNGDKPLAMREDEESDLRGFIQVGEDTRHDYPFYEYQYIRRIGFGGWNRVGALVYRVGNGTYAVPTGYALPMV